MYIDTGTDAARDGTRLFWLVLVEMNGFAYRARHRLDFIGWAIFRY